MINKGVLTVILLHILVRLHAAGFTFTELCGVNNESCSAEESDTILLDWKSGVVVPIREKKDHQECNNYLSSILSSFPGMIFAQMLLMRIHSHLLKLLILHQLGLARGKLTTDYILELRVLWSTDISFNRVCL